MIGIAEKLKTKLAFNAATLLLTVAAATVPLHLKPNNTEPQPAPERTASAATQPSAATEFNNNKMVIPDQRPLTLDLRMLARRSMSVMDPVPPQGIALPSTPKNALLVQN